MKRYCLTHCLRRLLPIVIGLQFVLLTNGRPVQAQESTFGLQFLGTSEETSDARARGLGVLGIALDERRSAITQNPATLAQLDFMTLSAMFVTGSRTTRSTTAEEDRAVARGLVTLDHGHVDKTRSTLNLSCAIARDAADCVWEPLRERESVVTVR